MSAVIRKIIGSRIRALRKRSGLSQEDVAEAIDCDNATLSRYERGLNAPDAAQLVQLAQLFRISPSEFLPDPLDVKRHEIMDIRTQLVEYIYSTENIDELRSIFNFATENKKS